MAEGTPLPIRYELMARTAPEGPVDLEALISSGVVREADPTQLCRPGLPGTPAEIAGDGELELEIGFGRGRFLIERAAAAPASRIVGIEIKAKWAHLVEQRRVRLGLANVVALCGDAREVLPRIVPDGSLARVFVHFPDPWWKKRHARRRVVDDDFLVHLARLLRRGGALFVQTDVEDRAIAMAERIAAHPQFAVRAGFEHENPYGARSNREVRAQEDGLPIYRVHATRI